MFDLRRPCKDCPFRKDNGGNFQLGEMRVREITDAVAFQCHKTVVYGDGKNFDRGDNPQQCAGLMALLHKEGRPNAIMQVAKRLNCFDASVIDGSQVYNSVKEAIAAHTRTTEELK